jgi:hypothetical protein
MLRHISSLVPAGDSLTVTILLTALSVGSPVHAREYFKTYSIAGRADVHVRIHTGSVRVTTSDVSQVEFRVTYDISPWSLGFGSGPHVDSVQKGNVVELNATMGWHVGISMFSEHMSTDIRTPKDADLRIEADDGHVEIAALSGRVTVRSTDGGIDVAQLTGTIDIRSTDGAIRASALKGNLRLQTTDGSITGANLDGRCVAYTNDGAVQVTGRFDALDLRSDDGMVTARVESGSTITSMWRIRTNDGSVHVSLPSDFKANLDARTLNGHVDVDLPVEAHGNVSKLEFHGTMNGGGPAVDVRTADGAIDLKRQ